MRVSEFAFKNFHLGRELNTAGDLLYEGFAQLEKHANRILYREAPAFVFLYDTSIAFERLMKILIYITIDIPDYKNYTKSEKKKFRDEYVTHSTTKLAEIISGSEPRNLGLFDFTEKELKFFEVLTNFYNARYARFDEIFEYGSDDDDPIEASDDLERLQMFLVENFPGGFRKSEANAGAAIEISPAGLEALGAEIGTVAYKLYRSIKDKANEIGSFTWELYNNAPSEAVFLNTTENKSLHQIFEKQRALNREGILKLLGLDVPPLLKIDDLGVDDRLLFEHVSNLSNGYDTFDTLDLMDQDLFDDQDGYMEHLYTSQKIVDALPDILGVEEG